MSSRERPGPGVGKHVVVAIGVVYVLLAVAWTLSSPSSDTSLSGDLIVFTFIGGSGAVLLGGGYRLPRTEIRPEFYPTIAKGCLAGIAVMIGILGLYSLQPDSGLSEPTRSVLILTGFSSVAGFGMGTYSAQSKTQARRLEQQNRALEQMQAQLEESNERLEQFAYTASHDLREPLRMISSYLQLIEQRSSDDLDEETGEFLEYAVDGSERMQEMIDGLLDYSRVDTQGEPLRPVDLQEVLDDVRRDLEVQIAETDAEIEIGELPRVQGDESQLRQLFQNLFSNGIEYSGDERPRISVTADRDGDRQIVEVRDRGIGIAQENQDRVFEVFQRLHSHEDHQGSGIGLALCQRIAERHDGDIWVDSAPGAGTTFSVALPAATDRRDRTEGSGRLLEVPASGGSEFDVDS